MQFQVPQFIEVEDKIFGPLTVRQFIYLAGAAGISFILYVLLPLFLALLLALPVILLALALAFYKVNNRPFVDVIEAAFRYTLSSRLYLWRKDTKAPAAAPAGPPPKAPAVPALSGSKLKDLAWSLDIKERVGPKSP